MGKEKDSKSQSEYNSLKRQKNNVSNSLAAAKNKKRELQAKLSRLQDAKAQVSSLKSRFKSLKETDYSTKKTHRKWKGRNYTRYKNNMTSLVDENKSYYNEIDYILDRLNDKITGVTNELSSNGSLISKLSGQLRWLGTKIENFWN